MPKMTGQLGKKAKTPTMRGGRSNLQALQEQFVAQLKSPENGPMLEKSSRKKKQKVTELDQIKTPMATGKDVSGQSVDQDSTTKVTPPGKTCLVLVEGHDAQLVSTFVH